MPENWYKSRAYLHFDRPINQAAALELVSSPKTVAKHAFYPFIRYVAQTQKVFFDKKIGKVVKKDPKQRPISYAAHVDSHIYSYYCELLNRAYEDHLARMQWSSAILAFRALGKSNIDFARDAFLDIAMRDSCCVIAIDIKGFFDNLDHAHLKNAWQSLLGSSQLPDDHYAVYRSLTKFSFVHRNQVYETLGLSKSNPKQGRKRICEPHEFRVMVRQGGLIETNKDVKGIPQGSPISAMLSNVYMMGFDEQIHAYVQSCGGAYYRYCDDVLLIVPLEKETEAKTLVDLRVSEIALEIQTTKTETCKFKQSPKGLKSDRPLQYLGFTFDGANIYLRSSSLARYQDRVHRGIWLAEKCMGKINAKRISRGQLPRSMFLKKLYKRYSYLGRRNFISYGYRAARIMGAPSIKKQLKPHWSRLRERISDAQGE
ncbi:antiviral reverse transcriptase Drt2 [Pseudomonas sp. PNP]|uniref:antiviral reverse transcriptase Drt2 n=1 Tax=Pseudomonas sp. PNP TaxID=361819 RepID=UPI001AECD6FF|nr:antiviral reverse transcriptase Drt2 [Pseudomonas sp. PNP]MBP2839267.1 group II intron reverse transcriptase domain-containing protein [Pseudomonas sp. PNP]